MKSQQPTIFLAYSQEWGRLKHSGMTKILPQVFGCEILGTDVDYLNAKESKFGFCLFANLTIFLLMFGLEFVGESLFSSFAITSYCAKCDLRNPSSL